jgi:hypothetical protein
MSGGLKRRAMEALAFPDKRIAGDRLVMPGVIVIQ